MMDLDMRITEANLSVRTLNLLRNAGVDSVRDLQRLDESTLTKHGRSGKRSISELKGWMNDNGVKFNK